MTLDSSTVYVADIENRMHAVDLSTGNKVWTSEFGGEVVSNLLVVNDALVFVTKSESAVANSSGKLNVRAVSRQTGITLWQEEVSSSERVWLGAVNGTVVAVASEGWISSFTRSDGKLVWNTNLSSQVVAEPIFSDLEIRLGTRSNQLVGVEGGSGKLRVVARSENLPTAILTDKTGRLLVGDDRGNLTTFSADGGRLWNFRNGAQIASVMTYESEYVAVSYDNFIYKLSRGGNVEWKRRLPGRVNGIPTLIDKTAVIAVVGTGSVFGVNLRNGKISNRIELGEEVSLSVAGAPDGNGFALAGPRGVSYYNSKCPAK